ncbi:hypothetical protein BCV72DRAFT_309068 [Rhizopus microsporus var. microsporus]|uniref:CCHC-type domain-containing protein n=1 Tax=Rhizopus microsporus var. microsporus TaxID=86635 RepID=A0A1X0QRX2_RHIZD|nr:hypothetical protein BCV72DRAFT_309068 [Rhizopus microsporus var. microsporus]
MYWVAKVRCSKILWVISLRSAPALMANPSSFDFPAGPSLMEINAFQRKLTPYHSQGDSSKGASGADGTPICGHCNKVGHLSKKCRSREYKSINKVELTNDDNSHVIQPTVSVV